jgi:hypothetical protein
MAPQRTFSTWRIALFILIVSSIVWLGGINVRAMIADDMLKSGTLEFEEYLSPEAEREIFRLLSLSSLVVIVSYCVVLLSSMVFLATSPFKLKDHGWLLMSAILLYLFVPMEIFTLYLDAKMIYHEFMTTADNTVFRELFTARVAALSGVPIIAILCYYTIIGLSVFQPFKKVHPQSP